MNPYELEVYARSRQAELLAVAKSCQRIEQARTAARAARGRRTGESRPVPGGSKRPAAVPRERRRRSIIARIGGAGARLLSRVKLPPREAVAGRNRPA